MGLLGGWLGILMGLIFPISRGLSLVVLYNALNKRITATFRATVNSLVSFGTRGLFIITGPILGYWIDTAGVKICLAVFLCPFYC